jgi:hypothetical protein
MTDNYDNAVPVFQLKTTYGSNSVKTKIIGVTGNEEDIRSKKMEFQTDDVSINKFGKNVLYIDSYKGYNIKAQAYISNIGGTYLVTQPKWPVMYMSLLYERKFVSGCIFSIFVFFEMSEESKKELSDLKKYVNNNIYGKFSIEIIRDDKFDDLLNNNFKEKLEEKIMASYSDKFTELSNNDPSKLESLMEEIQNKITEELNTYKQLLDTVYLEFFTNKTKIIKYMTNLCKNKKILELIRFGINEREEERRTKNDVELFEMPQKYINLRDIKNNPELLEKILDDYNNDS